MVKNIKIKIVSFTFVILILISSLLSCTVKDDDSVKDKPTISQLSEEFDKIYSNSDKLDTMDESYITYMMNISLENVSDYVVKMQVAGTAIDMYGIFITGDDDTAVVIENSVNEYLKLLKNSFSDFSYLPEESYKLDNAECVRKSNYVMFTICSDSEKSLVIDYFKENV